MAAVLEGPRLRLRPWRDEDRDAFARMSVDPAVMEHLRPLPDRAASDAVVQRIQDHFARYGFGLWVVELPGVSAFIGSVGLLHVSFEAHFTPAVEVAWRLIPAYWGQGYATEAAGVALEHGFECLDVHEIVAMTVPANRRSRAVMERLGMSHAEGDDFDHPQLAEGHPLRRHVLYRLGREDWRRR